MDYSSNTEIWLFISQVVNLILKLSFSMQILVTQMTTNQIIK